MIDSVPLLNCTVVEIQCIVEDATVTFYRTWIQHVRKMNRIERDGAQGGAATSEQDPQLSSRQSVAQSLEHKKETPVRGAADWRYLDRHGGGEASEP